MTLLVYVLFRQFVPFICTMVTRSAQWVTQSKHSIENRKLMLGRHKNRQSK
jgi:hypothetical protein